MEMTSLASSTALEPAALLEGFLAHPPLGFEASRLPSGLPTFRAPLDLTTTMDDALRGKLLGLPLSRLWRPWITWQTRFVGATSTEYTPLPAHVAPEALAEDVTRHAIGDSRLLVVKDLAIDSPLLDDAATLSSAANEYRSTRVLRLGIGCGMGRRVPLVFKDLARKGYTVRAVEVASEQRAASLADGTIDAAFFRGRVRDMTLRSERVWEDRLIAAMPEHHPLAGKDSVSIQELAGSPVALASYDVNPALHDVLNEAYSSQGLRLTVGIPFTSVEATFAVMAANSTPMWTPIYETYEAEHQYEGIRVVSIEPTITIPTFLVAAPTMQNHWYSDLIGTCETVAMSCAEPIAA